MTTLITNKQANIAEIKKAIISKINFSKDVVVTKEDIENTVYQLVQTLVEEPAIEAMGGEYSSFDIADAITNIDELRDMQNDLINDLTESA